MIGKMAIAAALPEFNDLAWTFGGPYFSLQEHIVFTIISTLYKNKPKNQCGKLKKNSTFLSAGHPILLSCSCKAREIMVAKYGHENSLNRST